MTTVKDTTNPPLNNSAVNTPIKSPPYPFLDDTNPDDIILAVASLYKKAEQNLVFTSTHLLTVATNQVTLNLDWQAHKSSHGFKLQGRSILKATLPCDRCTEPCDIELPIDISETFVFNHTIKDVTGYETQNSNIEVEIETFEEVITPTATISLSELVNDYTNIALTERQLCQRENCDIPVKSTASENTTRTV